jgi:hypothetical protein
MKYLIFLFIHLLVNAETISPKLENVDHYSAPAFIEYEKNTEIKYNNQVVIKNINDTISSFNDFEILIYYHDDKSYYYALDIKRRLKLKMPTKSTVKITLCGKGCYYEMHYSYVPHGVAVFYKNLAVHQKTTVSSKLSVTNK